MAARSPLPRVLLATSLSLAMMTGFVAASAPASAAVPSRATAVSWAASMLRTMNAERAAHRLPALRSSAALVGVAHSHNLLMARSNRVASQFPGELTARARITDAGYSSSAAENLARTSTWTLSAASGLQQAMYSETSVTDRRRENLLNPAYRYVGVDITIDSLHHTMLVTQDFSVAPAPRTLPAHAVGGYWETWSGIPLAQIPAAYNVVYVAFAKGSNTTSGALTLPPMDQGYASFKADVATLKARGVTVLLSIGGWNDIYPGKQGYTLRTAQQIADATSSLKSLVSTYGFDGIDWDLEHTIYPTAVVSVTKALKAASPGLLVTFAPMRSNTSVITAIADALGPDNWSLIGPQYYNRGLTESASLADIISGTKALATKYGASKVMVGTMQTDDSGVAGDTNDTVTIATCISAWKTLAGLYPSLRGEYVWAVSLDKARNYQFASQVGAVIIPGTTVTPPPAPAPAPTGDVTVGTSSRLLSGVDVPRLTDYLVAYTPRSGSVTPTNQYGTEATVVGGVVVAVVDRSVTGSTAGTPIPVNGVVLSGHGTAKTWLNSYAKVGVAVQFPAGVTAP